MVALSVFGASCKTPSHLVGAWKGMFLTYKVIWHLEVVKEALLEAPKEEEYKLP